MHSGDNSQPVAILMTLFDGAPHVEEQLESLHRQTYRNWTLHVSDDGSRDDGPDRVRAFALRTGHEVRLYRGPGAGYASNFLSLLDAPDDRDGYAAFCDHDDIWLPDKLARAVSALADHPSDRPALYGARTWIWTPDTDARRLSQPRPRPTGFRNALAQNYAGGNTMVFNRAAIDLARRARDAAAGIVSHDWWLYQIVTGGGGTAIFDPEPALLYRQHHRNQIGANDGARAGLARLRHVFAGRYANWNDANLAALDGASNLLTEDSRKVLSHFAACRSRNPARRLVALYRSGLYRQSLRGTLALWAAALFGKL